MKLERQVYLLNPKELSPETIAVTFAKTSRSPQSFRQIAAELTDEQSAQFHEKWVVGYGHASVAEHAVLHIAIENVSRLAIETIESNRLASYTEKSTRYQKWNPEAFYLPPELEGHALQEFYIRAVRGLFEAYEQSIPKVKAVVEREEPLLPGESQSAWERRVRSQTTDVCRFLLPAASLANVGVTANARVLEHAIQKMLSHPLSEVRALGAEVKQVAQAEVPTLLKYADHVPYIEQCAQALENAAGAASPVSPTTDSPAWCRLVAFAPQAEERVLAAALFRYGNQGFAAALEAVRRAGREERERLADIILGSLGPHDIPLRELEHASFSFELIVDQGAYFEIKRHRMMTQTPQALTADLGYAVPRRFPAAGLDEIYCDAMNAAQHTYEALAGLDAHLASYVVPNGFNRRLLMTLNLREAYQFCALRSAPNAHFSVRRVALCMAEQIRSATPTLAQFLRLPKELNWQEIEDEYFART
ncbi:MAG: FAD-dependent thymidylate synthase [Chloroflexi bacterium]|nr:FAD-dependent thymidylate synthase [Chloroflexota bacterium]